MNFPGKVILLSFLVVVLSGNLAGICEETDRSASDRGLSQTTETGKDPEKNIGAWFASVYRDHISRVDSDRCPSIPTCSSYSARAFEKHGFFIGWLMTVDRLIHEADEGSVSPVVYHKGRFKILDPVENNDFWWFCDDESTQK